MTEILRQRTPISIPTALRTAGRVGIKTLGCIGLWMNSLAPLPHLSSTSSQRDPVKTQIRSSPSSAQ